MPIHVSNADVTKNPAILDSISPSSRITRWREYFVFKWNDFTLSFRDKEVYRIANNLIMQIEKDVREDSDLQGNYRGACINVIDPQVDFVRGSFHDGDAEKLKAKVQALKVASHVARFVKMKGGLVLASKDLHPPNSVTFTSTYTSQGSPFAKSTMAPCEENGMTREVMESTWPLHCLYYDPKEPTGANYRSSCEQPGAKFDPSFSVTPHAVTTKGQGRAESYSTFFTVLGGLTSPVHEILRKNNIKKVYTAGLCTDYCAGFSAAHAAMLGFKSTFLAPASAGVNPAALANLKASIPLLDAGKWRRDINDENTVYEYRQDVVPHEENGAAYNGVYYKPHPTLKNSTCGKPQLVIMEVVKPT